MKTVARTHILIIILGSILIALSWACVRRQYRVTRWFAETPFIASMLVEQTRGPGGHSGLAEIWFFLWPLSSIFFLGCVAASATSLMRGAETAARSSQETVSFWALLRSALAGCLTTMIFIITPGIMIAIFGQQTADRYLDHDFFLAIYFVITICAGVMWADLLISETSAAPIPSCPAS